MSNLLMLSPSDPRLRANPWNTNVVSPDNETKLDKSLQRFGSFKPILVREWIDPEDGAAVLQILGGEHRWQAALRIGLKELPVFNIGQIKDDRAQEISLADNARYGVDDALSLADLLQGLGNTDELQMFLPMSEDDLSAIFSATDIALEELELDDSVEKPLDAPAEPAARAPKTHTIMRFKVALTDAERITSLLAKAKKIQGYTTGDELTNAGDALVHLLLGETAE